ncbi:hypothetical protein BPADB04_37780 [Bacillus paranthracis]|nr:hypothetical protein BPADB04_37780 [Bacillus paranthracis]
MNVIPIIRRIIRRPKSIIFENLLKVINLPYVSNNKIVTYFSQVDFEKSLKKILQINNKK